MRKRSASISSSRGHDEQAVGEHRDAEMQGEERVAPVGHEVVRGNRGLQQDGGERHRGHHPDDPREAVVREAPQPVDEDREPDQERDRVRHAEVHALRGEHALVEQHRVQHQRDRDDQALDA
jgi:hypothetical protein